MSPTRWQIEPPPLAPGAGAQWLIAALVALGLFSLTMYQPALPSIATSLNITTAQVQLTLTVYLASFAIGQLIYGPCPTISGGAGPCCWVSLSSWLGRSHALWRLPLQS